jgi:serine/threonine protein kinase
MLKDGDKASHLLLGKDLEGGWKVTKKYNRTEVQTGGIYSCCYEVKRKINDIEEIGFLKAIDYSDADKATDNTIALIQNITNAYQYEKKILNICLNNGLNNIVRLLDSGGINVEEATKYPKVEYLILEHADQGDIRNVLHTSEVDFEWKIRSIHQVAKALSQLHKIGIAHQDVKPSNVINFGKTKTKLTDLGSACSKKSIQESLPEYLEEIYSGSFEYSPPELLYGHINGSWEQRRILCDLYLLGNMIIFYFMDVSMNSLLKSNLDRRLCWERQNMYNNFEYVKPYLTEAFEKSLREFREVIEFKDVVDDLEMAVRFLCNPNPENRGHSKNLEQTYNQYGLTRFLTIFDRIARKYKYQTHNGITI